VINECDAAMLRHGDLIATAARHRLVAAATPPSPSVAPRPVDRFRASLRQSVAMLVARRGRLSAGAPS
jgi:hypothetical protein